MTIRLKKRDDPDAFSQNQYNPLYETKKGITYVNLLNGHKEYVKKKR